MKTGKTDAPTRGLNIISNVRPQSQEINENVTKKRVAGSFMAEFQIAFKLIFTLSLPLSLSQAQTGVQQAHSRRA